MYSYGYMESSIGYMAFEATKNRASYYHSRHHFSRVANFAKHILINEYSDYKILKDVLVAAFFHDTGRLNDHEDPAHGYRSAMVLDSYKSNLPFSFDEESVRFAILNHCKKEGETSFLPVVSSFFCQGSIDKRIAACLWDADRLDLLRDAEYKKINVDFLSTEYAKMFANTPEHLAFYK